MTIVWLMVLYLSADKIETVVATHGPMECFARIQMAAQVDSGAHGYCLMLNPEAGPRA